MSDWELSSELEIEYANYGEADYVSYNKLVFKIEDGYDYKLVVKDAKSDYTPITPFRIRGWYIPDNYYAMSDINDLYIIDYNVDYIIETVNIIAIIKPKSLDFKMNEIVCDFIYGNIVYGLFKLYRKSV